MGNVLKNNVRLYTSPPIYGGLIDGTVDCVSSLIELGYKELEGNHVMAFAKQGGGYKENGKVFYSHLYTDFNNQKIRKEYRFPDKLTKMKLKLKD